MDLGTHLVRCGGEMFTGCFSDNNHPPCYVSCTRSIGQTNVIQYFVNVVNIPPSVNPTYAPPSPAWNSTVTFHANSMDLDNPAPGDTNTYRWSIATKPAGSDTKIDFPQTADPYIKFTTDKDIGTWRFDLEVDDNEGEVVKRLNAIEFVIPNVPPHVEIDGPREVTVHNPIALSSSKTTDDDGGNLTFVWDILQTPTRSPVRPQNGYSQASSISIPTTGLDVGDWYFRLSGTDNEGATVVKEVKVEVKNLKPRIVFSEASKSEIDKGDNLLVSTTVLNDDDGGGLTFKWEVVQEPGLEGLSLPYVISTASSVSKPSLQIEGTWIFRLTATDDEGESVQKEFSVLVDAWPPLGHVYDDHGVEWNDPSEPLVVNRFDYLQLHGEGFEDPDSPCLDRADRCHRTDGRPVSVSPGIVRYEWYVTNIPAGVNDRGGNDLTYYTPGPVFSIFGLPDDGPTLNFGLINIPEGLWAFELRAWDGEGNGTYAEFSIDVLPPQAPPVVNIGAAGLSGTRVTTPLSGVMPTTLSFTGESSYDPDNYNPYDPYDPINSDRGIRKYAWQLFPPTPQCNAPSVSSWGVSGILYEAGTTVPPACQGRWRIQLTVTDDDRTPQSSIKEFGFTLGNCAANVCLDTPTGLTPAFIAQEGASGAFIGYHIDSGIYDEPVFAAGITTRLEIFLHGGPTTPIYTALSGPATQTSRGQAIPLYWNGRTQSGTPVEPGKVFYVKVTLLDSNFNVLGSAIEYQSIFSELLKAYFGGPPTMYLKPTGGPVSFSLTGAHFPVDSYRGTLRDSNGVQVATFTAPSSATTLTINYPSPGVYTFELFAIRGTTAISVGTRLVTVYKLELIPDVVLDRSKPLLMLVNNDDDNLNGQPDLQDPLPAGDDDELTGFRVSFQPREAAGTLRLEQTLGADVLKLWTTKSKIDAVTSPKVWNFPLTEADWPIDGRMVFLEAYQTGQGAVRLSFTPAGSPSLPSEQFLLNTVAIDAVEDRNNNHVIEETDGILRSVHPSLWDHAFTTAFNVVNSPDPENFVYLDSSRFYLRIQGPGLDTDPVKEDILAFNFSTAVDAPFDGPTYVLLKESGAHTSTLISSPLIMTGTDIENIPRTDTDDGFKAYGSSGAVDDNAIGDRTWSTPIDGHLELAYSTVNAVASTWRLPVCGENRRKLPLRIHVFMEPFEDTGFDHDANPRTPNIGAGNGVFDYDDKNHNGVHDWGERSERYINLSDATGDKMPHSGDESAVRTGRGPMMSVSDILQDLRQTNSLWSPACIKMEPVGDVLIDELPLHNGTHILWDNVMDDREIEQVYQLYQPRMTEDVVDIFYGSPQYFNGIPSAGLAFPPIFQPDLVHHGGQLFALVSTDSQPTTRPLLAHELAHLLTNTSDSDGDQTLFYPTRVPVSPLTQVNGGRRTKQIFVDKAHMRRPVNDLNALGNRQLQSY